MEAIPFRMPLYLPAQGASETEATIIEWRVAEGDRFQRGQILAQIDSAKSVFDFEAPCSGLVHSRHAAGRRNRAAGRTGAGNRDRRCGDAGLDSACGRPRRKRRPAAAPPAPAGRAPRDRGEGVVIQGVGGYLPSRVVTNAELVKGFPELTDQYVYEVTGIRQRRWADDDERPSGMAFKAALEAIRNSGLDTRDIDAIIVATTTPDMAIPSTAAILQERLSLPTVPAFDLNAACSGWLYAVANARGMIVSGLARHVLTVGVEMQSRLLDAADRNAYFLFGDGAGAAIISAGDHGPSHPSRADRRRQPGHPHGPPRGPRLPLAQRAWRSLDPHRRSCHVPLCHGEFFLADSRCGSRTAVGSRKTPAGSFRTRPTAAS